MNEQEKKDPLNTILNGLGAMDTKNMPAWLLPLLGSAGGMGGTYMIWVKPIQEKLEKLTEQLAELEKKVEELQDKNEELEEELKSLRNESASQLNGNDFFQLKR